MFKISKKLKCFVCLSNYRQPLSLGSSEQLTWSRNAIKVSAGQNLKIPLTPEQLPFEGKEPLQLLESGLCREERGRFISTIWSTEGFCVTQFCPGQKLSKVTYQMK